MKKQLANALQKAYDHLDMSRLRISHCKDAEIIESAVSAIEREQAASINNPADTTKNRIDANELERMAKEHPDEFFVKGSGILTLIGAIRQLEGKVRQKDGTIKEVGELIHDMVVGMQAAYIDWQHGGGAEAGMVWIANALAGPGHTPSDTAPYGKDAQAYYDANISNPLPHCFCGRPSNIAWMEQGFCSDGHYEHVRLAMKTPS